PVIFCTIVLGIGSVRKAATVGKVGGLAFTYFLVMSTFALAIGYYAFRRTSDLDDYMLGGRKLLPGVAALSAGASDMSGWL
ncbi:cation:dicarboxylase symporter family transporter, partial [Mycolicibacterium smegmatis]|uniref:cation:dicarboxylate symporter family transporter n=1 Tax=Mycolicibacterium smegmatis TaxID=1772 RepID=UPI0023D988D5